MEWKKYLSVFNGNLIIASETLRMSVVVTIAKSSHRDLLMKYLFDGGYLPGKCVSVQGIEVS